jgi:hypothetical protein
MRYFQIKFFITFFLISVLIKEINIISKIRLLKEKETKKIIFTFWEPHKKMPGYLKLCIKTWKKFLPDYEIKILDYKSAIDYLGEGPFSNIVCQNMTLPIQVDALRVALLKKFGGIWMDADTIILSRKFFNEILEFLNNDFELIMLGDEKTKTQNIGFICSSNNSYIINEWLKEIIKKVKIYKEFLSTSKRNNNYKNYLKRLKSWNYLGNGIVDVLIKNASKKQFLRLNRHKINVFPENKKASKFSRNSIQRYQQLYFQKGDPKIILNYSNNLLLLHNSWTPIKYKKMSEQEFLNEDILLAKLFLHILN